MEAMRRQLGPFEVPLTAGRAVETDKTEKFRYYTFEVPNLNDKLVLNSECTLRTGGSENLVTITAIDRENLTLRSDWKINLDASDHTLIIYPWFLYERLIAVLDSLLEKPDPYISNALMLFGKKPSQKSQKHLRKDQTELNSSQEKAVQLCSDSNLAFVWGPSGTGKTTTLGHIIVELLAQKKRVLVTSTTNAAVDQALEKLSNLAEARNDLQQGSIIRVGQTSEETFGAGLSEVAVRLNKARTERLDRLRRRHRSLESQVNQCEQLSGMLKSNAEPQQLNFLSEVKTELISEADLAPVFGKKRSGTIFRQPPDSQLEVISNRKKRLSRLADLYEKKIAQINETMRYQESAAVQNARVILSTMANVYISSLLERECFDVVIVEEAGMAVLPTLFYCATLAEGKTIMVGDPKQLPPIVQSRESYVYKAMGRNIFEVTVPGINDSEFVVMLDTQYRMHPVIGDLVSRLFYSSELKNSHMTQERKSITEKAPYPGSPLVAVDTKNHTGCQTEKGSYSRFNEKTAQFCVSLARDAVRSGIESIAVISPYAAQARLIDRLLREYPRESKFIECRTVHRFQGGERDMVILDTVDTEPLQPGILLSGLQPGSSAANLINVALSRARGKLIIVADVEYFKKNSPTVR